MEVALRNLAFLSNFHFPVRWKWRNYFVQATPDSLIACARNSDIYAYLYVVTKVGLGTTDSLKWEASL